MLSVSESFVLPRKWENTVKISLSTNLNYVWMRLWLQVYLYPILTYRKENKSAAVVALWMNGYSFQREGGKLRVNRKSMSFMRWNLLLLWGSRFWNTWVLSSQYLDRRKAEGVFLFHQNPSLPRSRGEICLHCKDHIRQGEKQRNKLKKTKQDY